MGYLIGYLIAYVISGVIFGFITQYIANSKGYDGGFAWGFWLGIIGVLVVGFRPNQYEAQTISTNQLSGRPTTVSSGYAPNAPKGWQCVCGSRNPSSVDYCMSCHRSKEEVTEERVNCPHCGAKNKISNETCFACGKSMKEENKPENIISEGKEDYVVLLQKLSKLRDQGVLTEEEYNQKKKEILEKM